MNLIQRFNIFCAPPGGTHIYSLSIYMGPPRWGTQHFNFFSKVLAIPYIFLTCWLEKINIFKLISFVYIRIQIVFVSIENKRKQFEQGFRLVSMFVLSFFMFYSYSHILEFISKQKEPIRTNYQWELSYVFRKDNSTFCVPHQGGPIYIL